MNVNFYLVPDFAESALRRNFHPINKFLHFPTLASVLSINDIVTTVALQKHWSDVLGLGLRGSLGPDSHYELMEHWGKTCISDEHRSYLVDQVQPLCQTEKMGQEDGISLRYFNRTVKDAGQTYDIREVSDGNYGIVVPEDAAAEIGINKKTLRDMVEKMNIYMQFEEIARTRWFDYYLRSLTYA